MTTTTTSVTELKINDLTKTQFGSQTTITENELNQVDPEFVGSKVLVTDSTGDIVESDVTSTELGYIDGTTSNVQTQLNAKVTANNSITGATKCKITYDSKGLVTSGSDLTASDIPSLTLSKISDITATATELNYVDGVTSNIQTQLNGKQATLVSGTNIKTINGTSVLGSGDITVGGGSLSDIANAGTNVEFTAVLDNISSSDKISSPTISTEGLYVGNTSSYLSITDNSIRNYSAAALINTSFSWIVKLSISDVSTNKTLFSIGYSTYAVQVALSSGKLKGYYRTGSSGGTATITGTTELSNDTYYYIKVSKSSNVYSLSTSTDGETWTTEGSYSTSNTFYTTCDAMLSLRYAGVTYDLNGVSFETSLSTVDSWVAFSYNGKPFISSTIPSYYLENKATNSRSVSIIGTGNSYTNGVNIGYGSSIGTSSVESQGSVAIGGNTKVTGGGFGTAMGYQAQAYTYGLGIGYYAKATAKGAIQLGYGTNSTAGTFSVGLSATGSNWQNYQLLDSTGIIPVARIPDLSYIDTNATNATTTGKASIVGWGMPDYSSGVSLTTPTDTEASYTATKKCMVQLLMYYMNSSCYYSINDEQFNIGTNTSTYQQVGVVIDIYLDENDVLKYKSGYNNYGTVINRATLFELKGID